MLKKIKNPVLTFVSISMLTVSMISLSSRVNPKPFDSFF